MYSLHVRRMYRANLDVCSQINCRREGNERTGGRRENSGGRVRIARIHRAKSKGTDFCANICKTLRHGKATHTRGMNTRHRGRFHFSSRVRWRGKGAAILEGHLAEFRRRGSWISYRRRMEFVCRDLHLNRVDARAQLDRSTVMEPLKWDWSPGETSHRREKCMKFYRFEVSWVFQAEKLQSSVDTIHFRGFLTSWDLRYHFEEKKICRVKNIRIIYYFSYIKMF